MPEGVAPVYIMGILAQRARHISLYEAMRTGTSDAGEPAAPEAQSDAGPPAASPRPREPLAAGTPFAVWLARAGNPIVVRLPRGLAVGIAAAVLVLIFLAYWVGYQRAASAVADTPARKSPVIDAAAAANTDPRVVGLSYPLLIDLPASAETFAQTLSMARDLQAFLANEQVETIIVPVDNRVVQVFALRGFTEQQLAAHEHFDYRDYLKKLGRRWKNYGGATDFSAMRQEKFTGR